MDCRVKTSVWLLFLAVTGISTLSDTIPPKLTAFALLAAPFVAYVSLSELSETKQLILIAVSFLTATVLTTWKGVMYGWDSWLYIGSARVIDVHGWSPKALQNVNAHQFPGLQLATLVTAETIGTDIVSVAKFLPLLLKLSSILFAYLIVRVTGVGRRIALLAPLFLASFTPFVAWLTYHHITYGYALKFVILYLILLAVIEYHSRPILEWRLFLTLTILLAGLLVSHQFSTFQVMVLLGLSICVFACGQFILNHRFQLPTSLVMLFTFFFVLSILYYLWIGTEYFIGILEVQSSAHSASPPQPDPLIERRLDRMYTGGASTSTMDYWTSRRGTKNVTGIMVFGFSAVVAFYHFSRQFVVERSPDKRNVITFLMFGFVGLYGLLRTFSAIGIGVFGGTRRLILSSLPFAIGGSLTASSAEGWSGLIFKVTLAAIVLVFLLASAAMMPGYLLTENAVPSEEGGQPNRLFLTEERQSTYEWTRYGNHTQVGTQGSLYVTGVVKSTRTHVRPRVYAGDYSVVPDGTLFVVAEGYRRKVPNRGYAFNYRLTNETFQRYERTKKLQRVHDSGMSRVYQINDEK